MLLQVLALMLTLSLSLLLKMIIDLNNYERLDTCIESGTGTFCNTNTDACTGTETNYDSTGSNIRIGHKPDSFQAASRRLPLRMCVHKHS